MRIGHGLSASRKLSLGSLAKVLALAGLFELVYSGSLVGCSAGGGAEKVFGAGASGNGTGSTNGSGSSPSSGGTTFFIGTGGGNATGGGDSSACQPIVNQPEQIISYSPIGMYIMQDRSSSMVGVLGDPSRWPNSQTAITDFVNDPSSAGLYVGLGAFPPYPSNAANDCTNDCKTPFVPMAPLPGNAQNIANAYATLTPPLFPPNFTPTECGLNGMVDACANFVAQMQAAGTPLNCVGLLITDGAPDACNLNTAALQGILSTAAAQGIKTFALGLPGADLNFLNQLAQAGGTGTAIDATTGGSAAIVAALDTVRQTVVVGTKLPCEWTVPAGITPATTNFYFTPAPGSTKEQFGHVPDASYCDKATGNTWYYDNNATPTKVLVCPLTCDVIKAAPNPTVEVVFGCDATVDAPIR